MDYIAYVVNLLKRYFVKTHYMLSFGIKPTAEFRLFKQDSVELNKVMFAMNNMPADVHYLLFSNMPDVCQKHYTIVLDKTISSNLDSLPDNFADVRIKYIFIRINLPTHVNCVVIDKNRRHVILFDPQVEFRYDPQVIIEHLDTLIDMAGYKILVPRDLGFGLLNRLQYFDMYCQTYIVMTFLAIVSNPGVDYKDYSTMLNTIITNRNMGYFLFDLHTRLKNSGYVIGPQQNIWAFPTNSVRNILQPITFTKQPDEYTLDGISMTDLGDMTVVDLV